MHVLLAVPELRQAVARHSEKFNQLPVNWQTETLITVGATEAIAAVLMGVLNAGDEVIGVYLMPACTAPAACSAAACAMTGLASEQDSRVRSIHRKAGMTEVPGHCPPQC